MPINFVTPNPQQIYVIDMHEAFEEFRIRHQAWLERTPGNATYLPMSADNKYFESIVEQMVAHMEYQKTGVQSYVQYCMEVVVDGLNQRDPFHPYRHLTFPSDASKLAYLQLLSGFANHFFYILERTDYYTRDGILIGAYQGILGDALYLAYRPSVQSQLY